MRRLGRLLLTLLAAIAVLGGSLLAAGTLLDTDPPPAKPDQPTPQARAADRPQERAPIFATDAATSWAALERSLEARVGLAVVPLGRGSPESFGPLQSGHAWSTIKVPILVALLRERHGSLSLLEKTWAHSALTASNNEAAAALFGEIEKARGGPVQASQTVEETLRLAGITTEVATAPPPPGAVSSYGQTEWSLSATAQFMRAFARGCLLDSNATRYVLGLMEDVVAEQSWGLDEAGFDPSWRVAIKGGWGPEGSASGPYLVRQAAVLRDDSAGLAVAIAAQADTGSFEAGVEALNQVAAWLRNNLQSLGPPSNLAARDLSCVG